MRRYWFYPDGETLNITLALPAARYDVATAAAAFESAMPARYSSIFRPPAYAAAAPLPLRLTASCCFAPHTPRYDDVKDDAIGAFRHDALLALPVVIMPLHATCYSAMPPVILRYRCHAMRQSDYYVITLRHAAISAAPPGSGMSARSTALPLKARRFSPGAMSPRYRHRHPTCLDFTSPALVTNIIGVAEFTIVDWRFALFGFAARR